MKISFCLSALYGVIFLQNETFQPCEAKLGNRHVPRPSWPDPALLETAIKFRTSPLVASAPIKVSEVGVWRLA